MAVVVLLNGAWAVKEGRDRERAVDERMDGS